MLVVPDCQSLTLKFSQHLTKNLLFLWPIHILLSVNLSKLSVTPLELDEYTLFSLDS